MNNNVNVVIGKKQILRELKANNIAQIQIATDADTEYVNSIIAEAQKYKVKYFSHSTMNQIAQEYSIDVPCGAVGVLK